MDKSWNQFKHT